MRQKKKETILLLESSKGLIDKILSHPQAAYYDILLASNGVEVLQKIECYSPSLLILELMAPQIHGIEVTKRIKSTKKGDSIGVIITSYHVMVQNYRAAVEKGVNYFLAKPFRVETLYTLVKKYYREGLKPAPFELKGEDQTDDHTHCYHPIPSIFSSYIRFWGTRGSTAVSGSKYVRYGGSTSCLEIRNQKTLVILDAGTGLRELGETLDYRERQNIHLFVTHTHWDHITGFPFFRPLYNKNCSITVWGPVGFEKSTKELFTNMLAYSYFPIRLDEMKSRVTFKDLCDHEPISIGDLKIEAHFTNHPGPTFGFKVTAPNRTVGYIPDNEMLLGYHGHPNQIGPTHPLLEAHHGLIKFLKGCDCIIHEAQYFPEEYYKKVGWGHSSIPNATVLFKHTGCKHWLVTHHDPNHKDYDLEVKLQLHYDILTECGLDVKVELAHDGLMFPL